MEIHGSTARLSGVLGRHFYTWPAILPVTSTTVGSPHLLNALRQRASLQPCGSNHDRLPASRRHSHSTWEIDLAYNCQ